MATATARWQDLRCYAGCSKIYGNMAPYQPKDVEAG